MMKRTVNPTGLAVFMRENISPAAVPFRVERSRNVAFYHDLHGQVVMIAKLRGTVLDHGKVEDALYAITRWCS